MPEGREEPRLALGFGPGLRGRGGAVHAQRNRKVRAKAAGAGVIGNCREKA